MFDRVLRHPLMWRDNIAPLVAAAAITAAAAGGQAYATGKMNKKTRQWNEKMYGIQRADALKDWNMQNEYNSPAAQMQRYKDAGLNPNLIYGQQNEGATVRSTDYKSWDPQVPDYAGIAKAGADGIAAYQDFQVKQQTVNNLQAQNELINANVSKAMAEKDNIESQTAVNNRRLPLFDADLSIKNNRIGLLNSEDADGRTFNDYTFDTLVEKNRQIRLQNITETARTNDIIARMQREDKLASARLAESVLRRGLIYAQTINAGADFNRIVATTNKIVQEIEAGNYELQLRKKGISFKDPLEDRKLYEALDSGSVGGYLKALVPQASKELIKAPAKFIPGIKTSKKFGKIPPRR